MPWFLASIWADCLSRIGVDLFVEEFITGMPTAFRFFCMVTRKSGVFKKSDESVIMFVETPKAYENLLALSKELYVDTYFDS